ncbi:MAG: radical SAM protein [Candidatus Omnitrophota bacterium]
MKTTKKISIAFKLLEANLLKKRSPVIVSWLLTYRCNQRCLYCDSWKMKTTEMETEKILSLITEMKQSGTQVLHLTGGNPLLRDDIGTIIEHAKKNNVVIDINSNGSLVKEKINQLTGLDLLTLSFDGPEKIHDFIRGNGSYNNIMEAVEIAKKKKLKLRFNTVLSKFNLDKIEFILNKAKEFKIPVSFQPARLRTLAGLEMNPVISEETDYKRTINNLILEKKKNNYIVNSITGLKYLYNWPNPTKIKCVNSLIICRLQPNGDMYGCGRNFIISKNVPNVIELGFKNSFDKLNYITCKECWCASFIELNYLFQFNLDTILNIIKINLL